jgi:cobalamin biosynthesis Mg chelatase CobN
VTTARPVPLPHRLVALLVTGAVAALMIGVPPAAAHEGPGVLTVETDEPTDTGHRYVVRLVWQNDGHPAARDTTMTATAFAPDGTAQTPVPMTAVDDDGRFEATVELPGPGQWRVNFTSVTPTASVEAQADVVAPSTTATDAAPSSTASSAAPEQTGSDDAAASDDAADDGGSSTGVVVIVVLFLLVAVVVAGSVVLTRRRLRPPSDDTPASDDAPAATR